MCGLKVAIEPKEGLVHSSGPFFALTSHVVRGHQLSCKPKLVPWGRQSLVQVFTLAGARLIYWSLFGFVPYCLTKMSHEKSFYLRPSYNYLFKCQLFYILMALSGITGIDTYLCFTLLYTLYLITRHFWLRCLRRQSTHWVLFYLFHNINLEPAGREVF